MGLKFFTVIVALEWAAYRTYMTHSHVRWTSDKKSVGH